MYIIPIFLYYSIFFLFLGSGGGNGFYEIGTDLSSRSGSGGGALIIRTNKIILNGIITVSGNNGKNGEGGGAGGSLIINATSFYGNGYITANGGDGGFSGGLISGRMLFLFFYNLFYYLSYFSFHFSFYFDYHTVIFKYFKDLSGFMISDFLS